eukprot:CAMPEP_0202964622 /NCGR_PEP_ID=MMETSP1396-20130829/8701_1 /ASSEMBLY_ACC=CAM_ASM_000872 /TAXON_ID= /ORGANISM="Pseudokeronopsis sp., Strain Brazil" /LENGTH=85 /DNA_ID=CAMNT_0049686855 /DNA_START=291 /DNA_END=548 /DNA_ORIENTATION=+
MIEDLCSSNTNFYGISKIQDYQRIAYDWYVAVDLYVDLYMCTDICNCKDRDYLDEELWGTRWDELDNYEFLGDYWTFHECYVDLR